MDSMKSTNELMHDLEGEAPFRQIAGENEGAFLRTYAAEGPAPEELSGKPSEGRKDCPFCGASLREEAAFCIARMRPLVERRVIPVKKRRTGKPARILWTAIGIFTLLSAAAAVLFMLVLPALFQKSARQIPSPAEFRILAADASEEETQMMWSQEGFTLSKQESGFAIYETISVLTETPINVVFSEDGKCLFLALQDFSANESDEALKLVYTAFSAVYRAFPDNLKQLLDDPASFSVKETPDGALTEILGVIGADLPEGTQIQESLPIYPDRFTKTPFAHVYKTFSDGHLSLFVRFDSEGT